MMASDMRMSSLLPTIKCSMCAQEIAISMMGEHVCAASEPLPPAPSQARMNFFSRLESSTDNKFNKPPPAPLDTRAANRPFIKQDFGPRGAPSEAHSHEPLQPRAGMNNNGSGGQTTQLPHSRSLNSIGTNSSRQYQPTLQSYPEADPRYAPLSPNNRGADGLLKRMDTIAPGPFGVNGRVMTASQSAPNVNRPAYSTVNHNRQASRPSTSSSSKSNSSKASSSTEHSMPRPDAVPAVPRVGGYGGFGSETVAESNLKVHPGMFPRSQTFPNISPAPPNGLARRPSDSTGGKRGPSNMVSDIDEELDANRFVRTSPPREGRRHPSMGGRPPPRGQSFSAGRDISSINLAAEFGASNPYHTPSMSQSSSGSVQSVASKNSSRSSPPSSKQSSMRREPSKTNGFDDVLNDLQAAIQEQPVSTFLPKQQYATNAMRPPPSLDSSFLNPESPMDSAIQGGRLSPLPEQGSFPKAGAPSYTAYRPQQQQQQQGEKPRTRQHPPPVQEPQQQRRPSPPRGLPSHPSQKGFAPVRAPQQENGQTFTSNKLQDLRPVQQRQQSEAEGPVPRQQLPSPHRQDFHRGQQLPSPQHQDFQRGRHPDVLTPSPHRQHFPQKRSPQSRPNEEQQQQRPTPPPEPAPKSLTPARAPVRPTTAKGDCKGCQTPITGKSISSADGRLTGRYHKECFVCKTCKEPFATATFYVINDAPYCERHYHKLNNSCCFMCDRGIEGQYLETERKQKFHPNCLSCVDCRRVLGDEYYEMNGRVYCERDAMRKANQRNNLGVGAMGMGYGGKGGTGRMERRTTRLMMI